VGEHCVLDLLAALLVEVVLELGAMLAGNRVEVLVDLQVVEQTGEAREVLDLAFADLVEDRVPASELFVLEVLDGRLEDPEHRLGLRFALGVGEEVIDLRQQRAASLLGGGVLVQDGVGGRGLRKCICWHLSLIRVGFWVEGNDQCRHLTTWRTISKK